MTNYILERADFNENVDLGDFLRSFVNRLMSQMRYGKQQKILEQNELSDKIKLKAFLEIEKFDIEKLFLFLSFSIQKGGAVCIQ